MKFYRHKSDGTIRRSIRLKDEEDYDVVRGEPNIEFNLMEIEGHLSVIKIRLGWILGIIIVLIVISILGGALGLATMVAI